MKHGTVVGRTPYNGTVALMMLPPQSPPRRHDFFASVMPASRQMCTMPLPLLAAYVRRDIYA